MRIRHKTQFVISSSQSGEPTPIITFETFLVTHEALNMTEMCFQIL